MPPAELCPHLCALDSLINTNLFSLLSDNFFLNSLYFSQTRLVVMIVFTCVLFVFDKVLVYVSVFKQINCNILKWDLKLKSVFPASLLKLAILTTRAHILGGSWVTSPVGQLHPLSGHMLSGLLYAPPPLTVPLTPRLRVSYQLYQYVCMAGFSYFDTFYSLTCLTF